MVVPTRNNADREATAYILKLILQTDCRCILSFRSSLTMITNEILVRSNLSPLLKYPPPADPRHSTWGVFKTKPTNRNQTEPNQTVRPKMKEAWLHKLHIYSSSRVEPMSYRWSTTNCPRHTLPTRPKPTASPIPNPNPNPDEVPAGEPLPDPHAAGAACRGGPQVRTFRTCARWFDQSDNANGHSPKELCILSINV